MNVYDESNFVLELALFQDQWKSCEEILNLCEAKRVQLVVPAYSLTEPYETLTRRQKQRKSIKEDLDVELRQIARSATQRDRAHRFGDLTALLINIADEETNNLEQVRSRLMNSASVLPLDSSVLAVSTQYQRKHGFSPQDALVYSSVLCHLEQVRTPQSCFLNRNSKDFDDQNIVEELGSFNCVLLPRFDHGYGYILNALR
ncbi:MAG: PIN domain-containing protein [Acidobacteria bacterium]|nr:PIN domain-containing protein [Acidobacteriota bacterium]